MAAGQQNSVFNFSGILDFLSPKTPTVTEIQQAQPVSDQQQRQNTILFVVAAIVMVGMFGFATYYIIKK